MPLPVTILQGPGLRSETQDYALLSVDARLNPPRLDSDALAVLAASDWLNNTKSVRAIGNGDCRPWDAAASDRPVVTANELEIVFESPVVRGASGGPVFSAGGDLVGMMIKSDGRRATARAILPILSVLTAANIEIQLRPRGAEGGGAQASPGRPKILWKQRIGIASWRNSRCSSAITCSSEAAATSGTRLTRPTGSMPLKRDPASPCGPRNRRPTLTISHISRD